jgi:hypothetical protein
LPAAGRKKTSRGKLVSFGKGRQGGVFKAPMYYQISYFGFQNFSTLSAAADGQDNLNNPIDIGALTTKCVLT